MNRELRTGDQFETLESILITKRTPVALNVPNVFDTYSKEKYESRGKQ